MQVEKQLFYDRLEISTGGLQIGASPVLGSLADARCLCQPVTLSASLFISQLADPTLPALRAKGSLGVLRIALDPVGLDALKHALGLAGTSHHDQPVTSATGVRIHVILLHLLVSEPQNEHVSNGVWPFEKSPACYFSHWREGYHGVWPHKEAHQSYQVHGCRYISVKNLLPHFAW